MDKKARKILLDTYWGSGGWRKGDISEEDHEYAIAHGVMFKPIFMSHSETLKSIKELNERIKLTQVAAAFLYSLSTRRLEYRSALGSYIYANSIPEHQSTDKTYCNICGYSEVEYNEFRRTWDVYNFERVKWGGVRHDHSSYAIFDLIEFEKLPAVEPAEEDIRIFKRIVQVIRSLENGGPRDIEKAISKEIPSNKAEREILLGILGICGIMEAPNHQGYLNDFTPLYHRDAPPIGRANDWHYPISWWKAKNGINEEALYKTFKDFI